MATRSPRTRPWTRADLERLPDDGNRYEVLNGKLLVTSQAAFGHQRIAIELMVALSEYCARHGIGTVVGPGAVVFGKNELQPDVQVIPGVSHPRSAKWSELPLPILVAEVLSDSTYRRDVGEKREAYLKLGVHDYWVVDGDARQVLAWTRGSDDPVVNTDVVVWTPDQRVPPLELSLATIFGPRAPRDPE